MLIQIDLSSLREVKWHEYLTRFVGLRLASIAYRPCRRDSRHCGGALVVSGNPSLVRP
jgi:hypothetical protein